MTEYVNSFLLLTLLGIIYFIYHRCRRFFRVINIVMDSAILNQLNNIEKEVNSEVTKSKRGRKKKIDTKINDEEDNDIIEKRDRLITYVGKEYTKQQINEMDGYNIQHIVK